MNVFVAVDSEVDGLPIGPERALWAAESLRVKDLEAAAYRAQVGSLVGEALQHLLEATGKRFVTRRERSRQQRQRDRLERSTAEVP